MTKNSSTILGIGTDIIETKRIALAVERHGERFLERLFTSTELSYCRKFANSLPHFAGRFAAKEAIVKALGTPLEEPLTWQEIEIVNTRHGKPEVNLSLRLKKAYPTARFFITISHCVEYATATAILVGRHEP
ncbi:MAG: Holo-[acyl-carrier-protein] synthase [Chlamydiae bacterium]|nr:Holo-[acyl-carrier-protein] synthase [Chlamydiota bacterium]